MSKFPSVVARDLEGREVRVPEDLPAGPRIVMLAFQRWHTDLIETWEPALQALETRCRELSVWEVPALSRLYLPARAFIDGGMRAGIVDKDARQHTLTAYTNLSALARELGLSSLDTIHLLLVAPDGTILWRGEGAASEAQVSALTKALEELACGA
ncbi:hypothetical protein JW848_10860 [Candidatus Bipolaricaulota bacterium]|nr:hypothetical protein [Candidatus Bipolaricaulota bacterium]